MKKWAFLLVLLAGCNLPEAAKPVEKMSSSNGWMVELCFEKDDYKVYRFSDGTSEWRYYVVPVGEMIDHITTSDEDGNKTYHPRNTRTAK